MRTARRHWERWAGAEVRRLVPAPADGLLASTIVAGCTFPSVRSDRSRGAGRTGPARSQSATSVRRRGAFDRARFAYRTLEARRATQVVARGDWPMRPHNPRSTPRLSDRAFDRFV